MVDIALPGEVGVRGFSMTPLPDSAHHALQVFHFVSFVRRMVDKRFNILFEFTTTQTMRNCKKITVISSIS